MKIFPSSSHSSMKLASPPCSLAHARVCVERKKDGRKIFHPPLSASFLSHSPSLLPLNCSLRDDFFSYFRSSPSIEWGEKIEWSIEKRKEKEFKDWILFIIFSVWLNAPWPERFTRSNLKREKVDQWQEIQFKIMISHDFNWVRGRNFLGMTFISSSTDLLGLT